ncbi:hypothetical protein MIND_00918300 [Mycena indigotica]|uniref:MYND-type domain-containing protein n=1 Tax=Mycena indigotica TaxID=2126181 RepID=A0A8H6SC84_9AGAR|nr:uncharacterized protein MIND_00918300 [Mycena indigotica]KAF7296870.1 hypothetical protein MIND_00918300 [Mycena indigotica]
MHPSLRLSPERFPAPLRGRVEAAAHRSLPDVEFLVGQSANGQLTDRQQRQLVALWYECLNAPPEIPSTSYDIESDSSRNTLECAITALEGLFVATSGESRMVERGAIAELWQRAYAWLLIIDGLQDHLPTELRTRMVPAQQVLFVEGLIKAGGNVAIAAMNASPRLVYLLGRWWQEIVIARDGPILATLTVQLGIFVSKDRFRQLLDSVGGQYSILGNTLAKHLSLTFSADFPYPDAQRIKEGFSIIRIFSHHLQTNTHLLFAVLESRPRFVPAITHMLLISATTRMPSVKPDDWFDLFSLLLATLCDYPDDLPHSLAHKHLKHALKAGLVAAVASFTSSNNVAAPRELRNHIIEQLFRADMILGRSTVFHSVLPHLRVVAGNIGQLKINMGGNLSSAWQSFDDLLRQRDTLYDRYTDDWVQQLRACAHVTCQRQLTRAELKQCSGCKAALYCSSACQKADWRPVHKQYCSSLSQIRRDTVSRIGKRNLSFHHYLVAGECKRHRAQIAQMLAEFVLQNRQPAASALCVIYSFTGGHCVLGTNWSTGSADALGFPIAPAYIRPAQRSAGRTHLHIFYCGALRRDGAGHGNKVLYAHVFPFHVSERCAAVIRRLGDRCRTR